MGIAMTDGLQGNARLISAVIRSFDATIVAAVPHCCGEGAQITECIFKTATRSSQDEDSLSLILERYGIQVQITRKTGVEGNDSKEKT
jgi:hypothetical protein